MHNTPTFENIKDKTNDIGINVVQEIPKNKNAKILDKEAIQLLLKKAKEDGLILEGDERCAKVNQLSSNSCMIAFLDDGRATITTF